LRSRRRSSRRSLPSRARADLGWSGPDRSVECIGRVDNYRAPFEAGKLLGPDLSPNSLKPLSMKFDMATIENLGLNMYTRIPPVISELVANAWDADSKRVVVTVPKGKVKAGSTIVVQDWGTGMTYDELDSKYLIIGRHRRADPSETSEGNRPLMGRKGIGKLAVFGVASRVRLSTVKGGFKTEIEMDINDIKKSKGEYPPKILRANQPATGTKDGTTVTLLDLKKDFVIRPDSVGLELGRRFSVVGPKFKVEVNGTPLKSTFDVYRKQMEFQPLMINEDVEEEDGLHIEGWMATLATIPKDAQMGIAVLSHGKLVQEPFYFGEPMGRHYAYSYLMGEVKADFLDEQEDDIVSSHRSTLQWDSNPFAKRLLQWGKTKILAQSKEWNQRKRDARRKAILGRPEIAKWYKSREQVEKEVIDEIFDAISGSKMDDNDLIRIADYVAASFEFESYTRLAKKFRSMGPEDFSVVMDLLREWSVIEAREAYKVLEGRLDVIRTLEQFVDEGVPEKHLRKLLYNSPWLLHPTWMRWEQEKELRKLVKKKWPDKDDKRRVDIVCVSAKDIVYVIELKRPGHSISRADLLQLQDYVSFLNEYRSTHDEAYVTVHGYMIGHKLSKGRGAQQQAKLMAPQGMYFKTYSALISEAKKLHKHFLKQLQEEEEDE
jgi:hypothetical protein